MSLWPRGLAAQIALAIALALLFAQAINLALLTRERERVIQTQVSAPVIARLADAVERDAAGLPPQRGRRGRLLFVGSESRVTAAMRRRDDIAERARAVFAEAGVSARRIEAAEGRLLRENRFAPPRRGGGFLIVSAEVRSGRWFTAAARLPRRPPLFGWLLGATVVLYVLVLAPVLWLVRRLTRPLDRLTGAVESFRNADSAAAVPATGPRDIQRLIVAYNTMRDRIAALLDEKDRMLGAVGHDLRTPLASLRVRAESMEDEGERAKMAATIHQMDRTLDDILSLARLGRPREPVARVDLAALVEQVVDDFQILGAPVTLGANERVPLSLRPTLIARALRNLIDNAVAYGTSARIGIERRADHIAVTVDDQGPGIPADRIQAMFEPFARLEESRSRETGGAGLGLALAKAIAEQHGGELTLVNRPQGGLRATLSLPVAPA